MGEQPSSELVVILASSDPGCDWLPAWGLQPICREKIGAFNSWRRYLSIVDTGMYEATSEGGCQHFL